MAHTSKSIGGKAPRNLPCYTLFLNSEEPHHYRPELLIRKFIFQMWCEKLIWTSKQLWDSRVQPLVLCRCQVRPHWWAFWRYQSVCYSCPMRNKCAKRYPLSTLHTHRTYLRIRCEPGLLVHILPLIPVLGRQRPAWSVSSGIVGITWRLCLKKTKTFIFNFSSSCYQ